MDVDVDVDGRIEIASEKSENVHVHVNVYVQEVSSACVTEGIRERPRFPEGVDQRPWVT